MLLAHLLGVISDKLMTKLQRYQKRGLRICLKAPACTSISLMHQEAKLLYLKNRMEIAIIKCMHRRIYRPNCLDMKVSTVHTRISTGPLFNQIYSSSSRFLRSLYMWHWLCPVESVNGGCEEYYRQECL